MGSVYEVFDDDDQIDRFEVRDLRVKTRFAIDNAFYDEFTPLFGPTLSMVYVALVRHSNKEQKTWPSQTRIAAQLGLSREWVGSQLQTLELFNLVRKVRVGKMCTNRYFLIDEKHWRRDFEEMRDYFSRVISVFEKNRKNIGNKVMLTEFTSPMRSPVNIRMIRSSHQMLVEFTSNRKDKQSKDKQKRRGKISIKIADKKTEAPGEVHEGKGSKVEVIFDTKRNALIHKHYD